MRARVATMQRPLFTRYQAQLGEQIHVISVDGRPREYDSLSLRRRL